VVAGRYQVKEVIASGPLGFLFRAHDLELDVEVALKVIDPRLVRTPEERRAFARLLQPARTRSHPNLLRVYEVGEDQERPYVTSQFLQALSLRTFIDQRLHAGGFFALHELEPILSQVCAALESAHQVGPHGDLRPEQVVVRPDLLKVTDFSLGLALPRQPFVQALRAARLDRYLAPELVAGGEVDPRADLYSVGVLLGEMLSGFTPDGGLPELGRRNPAVAPGVEGLYRKAIDTHPGARHRTPAQFLAELSEEVRRAALLPGGARPQADAPPPPPARPRPAAEGPLPLQPERHTLPLPPMAAGDAPYPDATQPVDPVVLARALRAPATHPETQVLDSRRFVATLDVEARPTALPPVAGPFAHERRQGTSPWLVVTGLVVLGVATGAGGGLLVLDRSRPESGPPRGAGSSLGPGDERSVSGRPADPGPAGRPQVAPVVAPSPSPVPSAGPGCPEGTRLVASGPFPLGTSPGDPMRSFDEKPLTPVELGAYCIDVFEFPNRKGAVPRAGVSFAAARGLCEQAGKRLCSEAEWEKACKGPGTLRWPYGATFDASACNTEDEKGDPRAVAASGSFGRCRSGHGVSDLSGNVAEWTQDGVLKGGSYASPDYAVRCSARKGPGARSAEVGFRCCASPR
jgi:serine/threonine protein kinase